MAESKTKTEKITEESYEELNADVKVTVTSIAGWLTGFHRFDGVGAGFDMSIPPFGKVKLSRAEIIAQVQNGNKLFAGTDGMGSHATLYIQDKPTRIELDFENGERKQKVFSDKLVKDLFNIKNFNQFQTALEDAIVTRAEKYALVCAIKRLGLNDYEKINHIEKYTGYKMYMVTI